MTAGRGQSMTLVALVLGIAGALAQAVFAEAAPATVSVHLSSPGCLIPDDFIGFSFETRRVNYNSDGVAGYFFDSTNTQVLALFHQRPGPGRAAHLQHRKA